MNSAETAQSRARLEDLMNIQNQFDLSLSGDGGFEIATGPMAVGAEPGPMESGIAIDGAASIFGVGYSTGDGASYGTHLPQVGVDISSTLTLRDVGNALIKAMNDVLEWAGTGGGSLPTLQVPE